MESLDLTNFRGTSQWYRFSSLTKAVLTDGTKYVAEKTNNFGLMQDIGMDLCLRDEVRKALNEGIILIEIDTEGKGLEYQDGNYKKIYGYELIGYPKLKIRLFAGMLDEDTPCIYLPSEY